MWEPGVALVNRVCFSPNCLKICLISLKLFVELKQLTHLSYQSKIANCCSGYFGSVLLRDEPVAWWLYRGREEAVSSSTFTIFFSKEQTAVPSDFSALASEACTLQKATYFSGVGNVENSLSTDL